MLRRSSCKRLRRRVWSPIGHGDHEDRRKTADDGERWSAAKSLAEQRAYRFCPTSGASLGLQIIPRSRFDPFPAPAGLCCSG